MKWLWVSKAIIGIKKDHLQGRRWWIPMWCVVSEWIHISSLDAQWSRPQKIYFSRTFSPTFKSHGTLWYSEWYISPLCYGYNLYNSAAFCKAAFNHPMKILLHWVARKGLRGIPKCVIQDEVKNRKEQLLVRGTVKAAVSYARDRQACLTLDGVVLCVGGCCWFYLGLEIVS